MPAAALNYMLDVDGSHDPEIIGKVLEELKQAGYNFGTAYQTAENGDQVVILREVTDPVIPTNPAPETPEDSDPTPPASTTPTTPAVQNTRPTTPTVEQAVAKTTPAPESGKLIQTGTTNWMADVLVRAGGVLLAAGYLLERKRKGMFHKAQH